MCTNMSLFSHVRTFASLISWHAFARKKPCWCTYGGSVYSGSHRRAKSTGRRRRWREGRMTQEPPHRLISSSWVHFKSQKGCNCLKVRQSIIQALNYYYLLKCQRLVSRKVTVKKNTFFCMEENSTIWFLVPQGWCFSWKKCVEKSV